MSRFGLLEMVRQRIGSSAVSITTEPCPCCKGAGSRRNLEWQAMAALKELYRVLRKNSSPDVVPCKVTTELAIYLLNQKRDRLSSFETEFNKKIAIITE
ncbi:MAG: hypothetical protein GYA47_01530 [Desulfovibrio sp.]|nr:hypothetical protein [Desulfovibrio sp.]